MEKVTTALKSVAKQKIALIAATMTPEKSAKVHELASLFRKAWQDYDKSTLIEQIKEIEGEAVKEPLKLSHEELLQHLFNEDIRIWSHKPEASIEKEIKLQKMAG